MLRRGNAAGYTSRSLLYPGSVLHTDTASSYAQIHRRSENPLYKNLGIWVTQIRHSRKQTEQGAWLPVEYVRRKRVQLLDGSWVWRKGGTQKKDGFWALIRKHVSRRAITTVHADTLREMAWFYQWMYWRSWDPISDALRGRHETEPCNDMLAALGSLRKRFVVLVGWEALSAAGGASPLF